MKQAAFFIDLTACTGCKTCMIACMDGHDLPPFIPWRRVYEYAGGGWSQQPDNCYSHNVFAYYLPISCNHCLHPVCVEVCPTTAMRKNSSGIVSVNHDLCVGCRYCEWNCPYSAPRYNPQIGKMTKCDFCQDRLDVGLNPLCVDACPMRAIHFGEYEELAKRFGQKCHVAPLPDIGLSDPCLFIIPPPQKKKTCSLLAVAKVVFATWRKSDASSLRTSPDHFYNFWTVGGRNNACGQLASIGANVVSVRDLLRKQSYFALLFIIGAAFLSMIHLGTPMHSPFTLLHIGSSWLSREITMVMLTGTAILCAAWGQWKKPESRFGEISSIVACVLGLILVYAMSHVYNSPFLPSWERASTFFLFLATTIILGSLWLACALGLAFDEEKRMEGKFIWRFFFFAMGGFALLAVFVPFSIPEPVPGMNMSSMAYDASTIVIWQAAHTGLAGISLILQGVSLWRILRGSHAGSWLALALIVGICGEFAGRSAFYMSYARLGM